MLQIDFLGEITTGNLHLVDQVSTEGTINVLGITHLSDIVDVSYEALKASQKVCKPQCRLGPLMPPHLPGHMDVSFSCTQS